MKVEDFVGTLAKHNFGPFTGIPCSTLAPMLRYIEDEKIEHYGCTSEGEAMGIAAGLSFGSDKTPIVYMQSDGFANALNPLTSLNLPYKIPALMIISLRGIENEPQHFIMGQLSRIILFNLDLLYHIVRKDDDIEQIVKTARTRIDYKKKPYAIIVTKETFEPYDFNEPKKDKSLSRAECLLSLEKVLKKDDLIVSSTGIGGREAYNIFKNHNHLYMAGSMGYASSIGLGLAISNPKKRVIVIDGDGALLMNLGSMSTIGSISPSNLIHICFVNNCYESTGGQVFESPNFADIAAYTGYTSCFKEARAKDLVSRISKFNDDGPILIQVNIGNGKSKYTARPTEELSDITKRIKENL